eukprot:246927-Rhodomonas_salina.2
MSGTEIAYAAVSRRVGYAEMQFDQRLFNQTAGQIPTCLPDSPVLTESRNYWSMSGEILQD